MMAGLAARDASDLVFRQRRDRGGQRAEIPPLAAPALKTAQSGCARVAREMYVAEDEREVSPVRSSCQALRIGAMVDTGSVVRKSMMSVLQSVGFSTSSPCEVPGITASSLSGRLR